MDIVIQNKKAYEHKIWENIPSEWLKECIDQRISNLEVNKQKCTIKGENAASLFFRHIFGFSNQNSLILMNFWFLFLLFKLFNKESII